MCVSSLSWKKSGYIKYLKHTFWNTVDKYWVDKMAHSAKFMEKVIYWRYDKMSHNSWERRNGSLHTSWRKYYTEDIIKSVIVPGYN